MHSLSHIYVLMTQTLPGESFRSFMSRRIKGNTKLSKDQARKIRTAYLNHFRSAGMNVEADALICLEQMKAHLLSVEAAKIAQEQADKVGA